MNKLPIFQVVFQDGSYFSGGVDYSQTKWLSIPSDKEIKRVFYKLPNNDYICLDNYDSYLHIVEVTKDLMGKRKGIINLEYAFIIGLKEDKVTSYRITLMNKKQERYQLSDVTIREFTKEEFIKRYNKQNWRPLIN
jgi:hypothetical protein